jgi:dethiobiotin synthetase
MKARGVFITGTDTGVGKTVVGCVLAAALREMGINVGVMKPVETGCLEDGGRLRAVDAEALARAAGVTDPPELVCPIRLREPMAPSIAAEIEGRVIELSEIREAYDELTRRHDLVLVEGAGGITVPIIEGFNMADLALDLNLPVLVVARPSLGTLNHSTLTVDHARQRGLEILGLVVSNLPEPEQQTLVERTNLELLPSLTGVSLLGVVQPLERGRGGHEFDTLRTASNQTCLVASVLEALGALG